MNKGTALQTHFHGVCLHIGVFAALLLCLYLMMVLAAAIPNKVIRENMTVSARYYLTVDRYEIPENGKLRQVADHYADQIWLNIGWHMGTGNPLTSVLDTRYYDGGNFGVAAGLHQSVTRCFPANTSYARYWHGSAALLRLLHLWTDIRGARTVGLFFVLLLVFITLFILVRERHADLALCLLASLLAVQVWNVQLSFEYIPSFLICFSLCPAYLTLEKRGNTPLTLLCVVAGTVTAFFDFLTTETVTVLLPLILVMAVRAMENRLDEAKETAVLLLRCLLAWGLAYGSAFLIKWAAAASITGETQFLTALTSAGERVNGTVLVNGISTKPGFLLGIIANLSVLFGRSSRTDYASVVSGLLICAMVLYFILRIYRPRKPFCSATWPILLLGALVPVRYAALSNHSYLHAFFTYRALSCTILAILIAMMINLRPGKKKGGRYVRVDNSDTLQE